MIGKNYDIANCTLDCVLISHEAVVAFLLSESYVKIISAAFNCSYSDNKSIILSTVPSLNFLSSTRDSEKKTVWLNLNLFARKIFVEIMNKENPSLAFYTELSFTHWVKYPENAHSLLYCKQNDSIINTCCHFYCKRSFFGRNQMVLKRRKLYAQVN